MFFSKIAYAFPLKSKKYKTLNPVFKKYLKKNKPKFIWSDKESSFFVKKCNNFSKTTMSKFIIPTAI